MIPAVNLIPAHRLEARRRRRRLRAWLVATCFWAIILASLWTAAWVGLTGPDRALARQLQNAQQQLAHTHAAISDLRPQLVDAEASLAAGRRIGDEPDWALLLALLSRWLDEKAVLTRARLAPLNDPPRPDEELDLRQRYQLELTGLAASQAEVSRVVLRLEQAPIFDSVKLVHTQREPFLNDQSAVGFHIECRLTR
ncbi:MAG: PilN domain-containing protein [Phycisphaeraceae bacterium]